MKAYYGGENITHIVHQIYLFVNTCNVKVMMNTSSATSLFVIVRSVHLFGGIAAFTPLTLDEKSSDKTNNAKQQQLTLNGTTTEST